MSKYGFREREEYFGLQPGLEKSGLKITIETPPDTHPDVVHAALVDIAEQHYKPKSASQTPNLTPCQAPTSGAREGVERITDALGSTLEIVAGEGV